MANKTIEIETSDLLLVVDVQKDFCQGGALAVPEGDAVIEPILRVAPYFRHIVLTQDWHPPDHSSFAAQHPGRKPYEVMDFPYGPQMLWPVHCVMDTPGAEFHPRLRLPVSYGVQCKGSDARIDSYSAFFENDHRTSTGLEESLRKKGIERIFLAGLAYDFCVGSSALDARRLGFETVVLRDACRAIDWNDSCVAMDKNLEKAGVRQAQTADLAARYNKTQRVLPR